MSRADDRIDRSTVAQPVEFDGVGLHTGRDSKVTIAPVAEPSGIRFYRIGSGALPIDAHVVNVSSTNRSTTVGSGDQSVMTVEHLLSALSAARITDALVSVDGPEIPILDGTAAPIVELLERAGQRPTLEGASIDPLRISESGEFRSSRSDTVYRYSPSDRLILSARIEYPQFASIPPSESSSVSIDRTTYARLVAGARTFCFTSEIEALRESGLIRGGSLDNALVIFDGQQTIDELGALSGFEISTLPEVGAAIGGRGPIDALNEASRHKILDLLGDLSLIGRPLLGSIEAVRPGHTSNIEFAHHLLEKFSPETDAMNETPVTAAGTAIESGAPQPISLSVEEIMEVLPHRYPLLLVDRVVDLDLDKGSVVGIKNVTVNEQFFQGHFPGRPIMPGVLIVEAMAQVGGLLLRDEIGTDQSKLALFMGIREAKFRRPVVPGDQLRLELTRSGKKFNTYSLSGRATVDGRLAAQAEITVAIVDREG